MAAIQISRRAVSSREQLIVGAVPTDRPVTIAEVAMKTGNAISTVRRALLEATDRLELEKYERAHSRSPPVSYFRRYIPGETRPLYASRPGVDAAPLALCWGGYTFTTTGAQHGIGQQGHHPR